MKFGVKFVSAAAAAAMALGAATAALADQRINWTLSDGAFDDGGTFSGTFTYDVDTHAITDWNVTTTKGSAQPGWIYATATPDVGAAAFDGVTTTTFTLVGSPADLQFSLTNLVASTPGAVALLTGDEHANRNEGDGAIVIRGMRLVTGGSALGVLATSGAPEPAAWALMIVGFGLVGATARLRHRFGAA